MSYLVLARKWRPQTFEDLTGQEAVSRIFKNAISNGKVAHAYIFSGPRGVGKTTTARILAKALNCVNGPTPEPCGKCAACLPIADGSSVDVSEIDGASNTGVDNIRDIRERVRYAPSGNRFKVYIIDEAHMLSTSAFNALLKTLEEPPPHVIFVLATTEPKKIPPTVLSRCQHLPFKRISGLKIKERLKFICSAEGINITDSALEMIARAADGSMRDSLTILDQIASFSDSITSAEINDLLGIADAEKLSRLALAVIEGNREDIIKTISELADAGADLKTFAKDMVQFMRNLLVAMIVDDTEGIIDLSEAETSAIGSIKDKTSEEHMALILAELIKAEPGIRSAFYPRIALEMTLIRLSMLSHLTSVNKALKTICGAQPKIEVSQAKTPEKGFAAQKKDVKSPHIETTNTSSIDPISRPLSSESIPEIWNAVLEKIDETNHPLCSKLKEGKVSFSNNEIVLTFNGGLFIHAESVKENMPVIKKIIRELTGKDIALRVETVKVKSLSKKELKEKALQNPIIQDAIELFDARIVDVIPVDSKE